MYIFTLKPNDSSSSIHLQDFFLGGGGGNWPLGGISQVSLPPLYETLVNKQLLKCGYIINSNQTDTQLWRKELLLIFHMQL